MLPVVHPHFAALVVLAVAHEQRSAALVEVGFGEPERLLDSQPGAPQDDDQAADAVAVDSISTRAHHGNDLLYAWRVGRVAKALLAATADSLLGGPVREGGGAYLAVARRAPAQAL